jgi:hypothetical protein
MEYEFINGMKWNGHKVRGTKVPLKDMVDGFPIFTRSPFGEGVNVNAYFDVITREPFGSDGRRIPVATVSKRYALLQHNTLIKQVVGALDDADIEVSSEDEAHVFVSEFGERMECSVMFSNFKFDPGDDCPLVLRLFMRNSVDGSCAFELSTRWYRQICSNGLAVLTNHDKMRAIHHLDRISMFDLRNFLQNRVPESVKQVQLFKDWRESKVRASELRKWVREHVRASWGLHAAARVFHILCTGFDGRIGNASVKKPVEPDELFVSDDVQVPGACAPADNVYHAYQALTWIADHRPNLEEREQWGVTALELARSLNQSLRDRIVTVSTTVR